jgi:hypothetical protein
MEKLFKSLTKRAQARFYLTQQKKPSEEGFYIVRDEGLEPPTFPV